MSVNRKNLILVASLVVVLAIGFIVVKRNNASSSDNLELPGTSSNENPIGPVFKLEDLKGVEYSLTDYKGAPVLVHFMSVSCGGEYSTLNDNQLKQLKTICIELCEEEKIKIFTVLVSTCETTDLSLLYDMYNITWILGNDYQDSKLDVLEAYSEYEPTDGMVILLDQNLVVKDVIKESITSDTLVGKVLQLEG